MFNLGAFVLISILSAGSAQAWFRLPCTSPLVQERLDPIVSPGQTPSQHTHTVHGAYNFAANSTYDTLQASKCRSCRVLEDNSNYWFPKLYFQDPSTKKFEAVPNGGLLIYYLQRGDEETLNGGVGLKAFPEGLRMISGDAKKRSFNENAERGTPEELAQRAVQWSCLRYGSGNDGYDGVGGFPTTNCESGYQSRLHFPSCWDGENVDSDDHKSHMAFLSDMDNGKCPDTHPVALVHLFYEVTWDIDTFVDRWSESDGWPFVLATGDPTGYSWHGDFQNGWDTKTQQLAIDNCNNPNDNTINGVIEDCKEITLVDQAEADACNLEPVVDEEYDGPLDKLPGCNPLQLGPEDAAMHTDANCPV
ncbi:hypothetical protein CYLTODRAFT_389321 [Cylindrobasidium torrendii FP15055 ss-10]|uniref:DUF1996 domain-containing protein n=1 Tax=Cylindrobasidium torrendii FP15055 ss-10 TaxID=1314674 RepID=A0A0D7BR56_9AGAR|nr:hypothetical protein CYLTODRAFT_389321 [Cylindrobasidium torrendii FP15055 ss-10]